MGEAYPEEFPKEVVSYFEERDRNLPWRQETIDPFSLLLTEILLQQTHAAQVESVFEEVSRWTPQKLRSMDTEEIRATLKPLGFSNKRTQWFKEIAEAIDRVPREKEELIELPGVSDYTANAVLCFGFGKRMPIYDVNVKRVFDAYFPERDHDEFLWALLPETDFEPYNYGLLDAGSALKSEDDPLGLLSG